MKVLISAYTFLPDIGGVATNVSILAKGFFDEGYDVRVVTLAKGSNEGIPFPVYRNPDPLTLIKLYREADILILSNLALKLAFPLFFMKRRFALRHHSESAFHLSGKRFSADWFRSILVERATHFMTSAYIGKKSGFAKYWVTHPFASLNYITDDVKLPVSARSGALFVGRVEPEKGVEWLIERWPRVRELLRVDELSIVGSGSLDGKLRAQAEAGALAGVALRGSMSRDVAAREMGKTAFVIVPSLWQEPFGAVALEGLAAGAIPIVADRGGLRETVGELGFYFDPDDEESFTTALCEARAALDGQLASPGMRQEWLRKVEQHLQNFEPARVVERIVTAMT